MGALRALEQLGRMVPRAFEIGHVGGGHTKLSMTDLAAACAGTPSMAWHLIRAYALYDQSSELECRRLLCRYMIKQPGAPDTSACLSLSTVIVRSIVDPAVTRCKSCNGTGEKKLKTCNACNGSGHVTLSQRNVSKVCGIPNSTWRKLNYSDFQARIEDYLCVQLETEARRIDRRLNEVA